MMGHKFAYSEPPSGFVRELSMPFEVAIHEFIDNNYDALARKYTQSKLTSKGRAPTVDELEKLEGETSSYMDDILPSKMLKAIDLDRIGYDRFVSQRLNDIMLDGIADSVLGARTDAPMESIASRVASKTYSR
jgi:hypothetical protein